MDPQQQDKPEKQYHVEATPPRKAVPTRKAAAARRAPVRPAEYEDIMMPGIGPSGEMETQHIYARKAGGAMPREGETLPKTGKSADWLAYADKKRQQFVDYHSQTNIFGKLRNPAPLQDDYSRLLSDHELQARKMGMDLLRQEKKREMSRTPPSYRKGGRAQASGPAKLHRGEAVLRKPTRKTGRR